MRDSQLNGKVRAAANQNVNQRDYWLKQLSGELIKSFFPFDHKKTPGEQRMAVVKSTFPGEIDSKLTALTKGNHNVLYIYMTAVLTVLLSKYTGRTDIIFVSPIYKQTGKGQFINTLLPLRNHLQDNLTFKELLVQVKQTLVEAIGNQNYPIDVLPEKLNIPSAGQESPLFDTGLLIENIHDSTYFKSIPLNMIFSFIKKEASFEVKVEYNSCLYEESTIERILIHLRNLLESALFNLDLTIPHINILLEKEKEQLLYEFNNSEVKYPGPGLIHERFEAQAAKIPDNIAVNAAIDLSDIYDHLQPGKKNVEPDSQLQAKYEKCCFQKNPFLFLSYLQIPNTKEVFKIVKTHRHNSVIMNPNAFILLDLFDGKKNLKSLFVPLKNQEIKLLIYSISMGDVLEISYDLGDKNEILLNGKFEDFISVVNVLYNNHLLDLVAFSSTESIPDENSLENYFDKSETPVYQMNRHLEKIFRVDKKLSKAHVLLLGDTPGMATTGLLYLASYLRRNGIKSFCRFYDHDRDKKSLGKNIRHLLQEIQPGVVAVSMKWFLHIARVLEICKIIKTYSSRIKVVVGGNTASYYPEEIIENEHIDFLVCGDGEVPLLEICRGDSFIQNCIYKKDGKPIKSSITYIEDETNGKEIYLSYLEEILLSRQAPLFGSFFIYTHKGCAMNCLYCGGCHLAHKKKFNRSTFYKRAIPQVRRDIIEAKKYTSTFFFDFDAPNPKLVEYCRAIWENIDLSSHFCILGNLIPPSAQLIELVTRTFKYVYWNLDIASLSERHRQELFSKGQVKPQPTDAEIEAFFEECEKYDNAEIRVNLIAGLPFFTKRDIEISEVVLNRLMNTYKCFGELHWARLHAQPGAPITYQAECFNMHSYAKTYRDFLIYSERNYRNNSNYPGMEYFDYPYVYYNDEDLNSSISKHYLKMNRKVAYFRENIRKPLMVYREISYSELDRRTNQLARVLREKGVIPGQIVALVVEDPLDVTVGIIGILKVGAVYLPIDPQYPGGRIDYILKDSGAKIIVSAPGLSEEFEKLSIVNCQLSNVNKKTSGCRRYNIHPKEANNNLLLEPINLAYLIYTSGSTGQPKGVLIRHTGLVNYTCWRLTAYGYTDKDITLQLLSYSFDGFCSNFYTGLLSGGTLVMVPGSKRLDINFIKNIVRNRGVTNMSIVPGIYNALLKTAETRDLEKLRFVVLAGEKTAPEIIEKSKEKSPHTRLINEYGPTETTVTAAANLEMTPHNPAVIGKPIANTGIYILDSWFKPVPVGVTGELCIAGAGLGRGYLNNPRLTTEKFKTARELHEKNNEKLLRGVQGPPWHGGPIKDGFVAEDVFDNSTCTRNLHLSPLAEKRPPGCRRQRIYRTGDLAKWLPDGNIELLGRLDEQVKVRGFRIELEEIENCLLKREDIKEAALVAREDGPGGGAIRTGEKYLCAYIISSGDIDPLQLEEYLSKELPHYMIPSSFIRIERIPLTPSGKVDRKALAGVEVKHKYTAPRNEVEEKLAAIWAEVLNLEKPVGIDDDFFELGGHSLTTTVLISKIHKEFNIKIPHADIYKIPTIRGVYDYISKTTASIYSSVEREEKKEYYPLSSAQKRLYFLDRLDDIGVSYNTPVALKIKGKINKSQFEKIFAVLISRHEPLRTWFELIEGVPVQQVHDKVDFKIQYHDKTITDTEGVVPPWPPEAIIKNFICPFDLSAAPLLRVGLWKLTEQEHLFLFDMHHIIADGTSMGVLIGEFTRLYGGEDLPALRIQYKDFSVWQNRLVETGKIKDQEDYWLALKCNDIPRLNLPTDYPRPGVFNFSGDRYVFDLDPVQTRTLKEMGSTEGVTLYMILLAAFYVLLHKYTGQEDIVVGSGIMGRPHSDLRHLIGMFVNSLAMRNYPRAIMTYRKFLEEVKKNCLQAYENQDVQFEDLVEKLNPPRDPSRNPIFDVSLVYQNFEQSILTIEDVTFVPYKYENNTSKFDMTLFAYPGDDSIRFSLEYYTALFKRDTIKRLSDHYLHTINQVTKNPGIRLEDIQLLTDDERRLLLGDFNDTDRAYPEDMTIHELFRKQVEKTPERVAVVGGCRMMVKQQPAIANITYSELNKKSNQLANWLGSGIKFHPGDRVGVYMDISIHLVEVLLGILKACGTYLPLDPGLPGERLQYMIRDAGIGVVVSQKRYLKQINRLQWECESVHTYLCVDSENILDEEEAEKSPLMDKNLWDYVADNAVDDITGGGWTSSYTGESFIKKEMEEYAHNILAKLAPLLEKNTRILEIGCASGISMYKLAPKVGFYYGTDLSPVMIEKNREKVKTRGDQNIALRCLSAHEIDRLEERDFDIIIMNSVIQAFHGHNYLRKVIRKSIDLLAETGYLFIGDVMDQDLKKALEREMLVFKRENRDKNYKTKIDFTGELFISRAYFEDLQADIPGIAKVEFSDKIYTLENELTRFRYDTLMTVDKKQENKKNKEKPGPKSKHQYDGRELRKYSTGGRAWATGPGTLAYVIYTSGSTGKPKGVMVEHGKAVNMLTYRKEVYQINPDFTFLQLFSYAFDGFVTSFFTPVISGGKVVLLDIDAIKDHIKIKENIRDNRVTHFIIVPSMLEAILENLDPGDLPSLKTVTTAGEKLPFHLLETVKAKHQDLEIANEYGVTEAAVMSTIFRHQQKEKQIKIGKPIANTKIYILDKKSRLQAIGIPGEIALAGVGVARGYLNNPELTAEKFGEQVTGTGYRCRWGENKQKFLQGSRGRFFQKEPPGRRRQKIYCSGDLARWLLDGNIEFLGRVDHQVKIRGFRIEPGEIEHQLMRHESIKNAVVIDRIGEDGDKYLCAYWVPVLPVDSAKKLTVSELREYLAGKLAQYMIPSYFIRLEAMPLTSSGKIHRKSLPAPDTGHIKLDTPYVSPQDNMEKIIADTWKEVLKIEKVGIHDNFFDLGGNSLKIIQVNNRLNEILEEKIPVVTLFKYPTISSLAGCIQREKTSRLEAHAFETEREKEITVISRDIAVIGMAGRFPAAKNIYQFRENLEKGMEAVSFFSEQELAEKGISLELLQNPNYVKAMGIIENKDCFDAAFFNYTPEEARLMDPQARLFHECAWEALEDAGYVPDAFKGAIGIYAGASNNFDWVALVRLFASSDLVKPFEVGQLMDKSFMTTRVSYKLNLKGPAVFVQTACSTSLAAIHTAGNAILLGDCDMALAGGVTVSSDLKSGYMYQEGLVGSPDGHCRAFDAGAGGTTGGDGVGIVVLKPLDRAVKDNDHIYALVKASAMNNDGSRKVGYSAPSIEGQAEAIREVIRRAGIKTQSITYIEAHGTGTVLGDPIEIEALKLAFNTDKKRFCAVGSVKTNVGHMDCAAGVAGFIKVALALKHKRIFPSLHYKMSNERLDLDNSPFYVNTKLKEWKSVNYPRRAGVSSFGIGGTNVHAILEEWPGAQDALSQGRDRVSPPPPSRQYQLILISTKTESALGKMTRNLVNHLEKNPEINLADAAYTLQVGRRPFNHRRMEVCSTTQEAVEVLSIPASEKIRTIVTKEGKKSVIFMFPGQGAQYVNMGRELYETESYFRQEMDRCFEILKPLMEDNLKEILYPGRGEVLSPSGKPPTTDNLHLSPDINQTEIAQPLLFVIEYSLARLLMKWGIEPQVMIGHSIGEYTAACLSGIFSLADALELVTIRGRLMQQLPRGAMLSISISEEKLKPLLAANRDISLAAVNAPTVCVVSGPFAAIENFEKQLKQQGSQIQWRQLHTSHAFHSKMMEPILDEFERKVKKVQFQQSQIRIPYISNLTGTGMTLEEAVNPGYWAKHLREPVRFARGLASLLTMKTAIFIEVGPGRALSAFLNQNPAKTTGHQVVRFIRHPQEKVSDVYFLLERLGRLWLYGGSIDWAGFYGEEQLRGQRISLPTYPFEPQRFWIDTTPDKRQNLMTEIHKKIIPTPDFAHWFYIPTWTNQPLLPPDDHASLHYNWLVFVHHCGLGHRLVERLKQKGQQVIIVEPGNEFSKQNPGHYSIDPEQPGDYHQLFNDLAVRWMGPLRTLHLWGVTGAKAISMEEIEKIKDLGFYSLMYIAQAIGREKIKKPFQIDTVTDHMQEVTGEEQLCPAKASVIGPVRVIPQEFPGIRCRSIDVLLPEPEEPGNKKQEKLVDQLLEEISSDAPDTYEPMVAYRGNCRWVQTFHPLHLDKTRQKQLNLRLKENGVYLVTGGTGYIGLILAQYLAEKVKARLILTGRSPVPPREEWEQWLRDHDETDAVSEKIKQIKELEQRGASVRLYSVDAADKQGMQQMVNQVEKEWGPIDGIIHAAGMVKGKSLRSIQELEKTDCEEQFQAKVRGTLVLEEIFRGKEPDFYLLISSISAVLGGLGFTAYAAANAFMDAFVREQERSHPGKWISVEWDKMDTDKTQLAFERILSLANVVVVAASHDGNLQARIDQWVKLEFLEEQNEIHKKDKKSLTPRPALINPYVAPRGHCQQTLAAVWQELFGLDHVGIQDDFFELGGDSLKALMLLPKIQKELQVEIPITEFFKHPTIEELSQYISEIDSSTYYAIEPAEKKEYYALSSAQKRLYLLQQMDKETIAYNNPDVVELGEAISRQKVEDAFQWLIRRHECFRTSIRMVKEEQVQQVNDPGDIDFKVEYVDLADGEDGNRLGVEEIIKYFVKPFDLGRAPFLRVGLIRMIAQSHILVVDRHHIVTDAVSHDLFVDEFLGFLTGKQLPFIKLHYKDYARWQSRELQQAVLKRQEVYWMNQFTGSIPLINLPTDFSRPGFRDFRGSAVKFIIGKEETLRLKKMAAAGDVTLYMVLLAIFAVLLAKVSGQEDIVVGTGVVGRNHPDLQNIMGIFVNTLVLRNYPGAGKSWSQFLKEVKISCLQAFENQDYPFEELVDRLKINRDTSRNPLFDVMLVLENIDSTGETAPSSDLNIKPYSFQHRIAKFDLTLFAREVNEILHFAFEYSTSLFKPETIEQLIVYFREIVLAVGLDPGKPLSEIEKIPGERQQDMIRQLNRELKEEVRQFIRTVGKITLQQKLQECFERFKYRTVIECGSRTFTYGETRRKVDAIAHEIISRGIPAHTFIGILLQDRVDFIMAMLGILNARCVFVPLDPSFPPRRLHTMIETVGIPWIITDTENFNGWLRSSLPQGDPWSLSGTVILTFSGRMYKQAETLPWSAVCCNSSGTGKARGECSPRDSIYIYFTSGTTGTPRAIKGKNCSLLHFIDWEINTFSIDETFRFSQLTNPVFDAFLRDVFVPLCSGGVICIPGNKEILLHSQQLIHWVRQSRIRLIHCVPSLFRLLTSREYLSENRFKELEYILLSGERINPPDLEAWYEIFADRIQLVNLWGTSETTLAKTYYSIQPEDIHRERVPVGQSLPGARVVVLDQDVELCDRLVTGELYIKTPFSTFGYHNDPALNKERFIPDPFSRETGILLHKTGDLGRILSDGTIDVIGRNDRQVKVQGIRVELEEIEAVLVKHSWVMEAAVLKKEISTNNHLLCAYITLKPTAKKENQEMLSEIMGHVSGQLPGYMVPGKVVTLEQMPRTTTGKVDYNALPDPLVREVRDFQEPRDRVEEKLLALWAGILKIEKESISVTQSFFELGGNSLNIMTLISWIHKEFDIRISLGEIFNNPTIRQQASIINRSRVDEYTSIKEAEEKEYYVLSSAQKRLYVLQQMYPEGKGYNMPEMHILEEAPQKERLEKIFRELIRKHESLRTSFLVIQEEPVQKVHEEVDFEIEYYDLQVIGVGDRCRWEEEPFGQINALGEREGETAARSPQPAAALINSFIRPFNLSKAPLLRMGVIEVDDGKYMLMVDMHHIISDGISHDILVNNFIILYSGGSLPALRIRYKDYSEWQHHGIEKGRIQEQEKYWLKEFSEEIPVLNLPVDNARPVVRSFEGATIGFRISREDTERLEQQALAEGATPYMILLAIYNVLLSKICNQEDIIVGTPTAGRIHVDLQGVIGMFVNTLALRNYPNREKTFGEFLQDLKKRTLEAFENQDYPFEHLVEKVTRKGKISRDTSRNPLFDAVFILQNFGVQNDDIPAIETSQLKLEPYKYEGRISKFDMTFTGMEVNEGLTFVVEYSTKIFKKETIQRFIGYFQHIVSSVTETLHQKIWEIDIISEREKNQLLYDFNDIEAEYPNDKPLHRLFAEQVERTPECIALVGKEDEWEVGRGENISISYRELNQKVGQLACLLKDKGIKPDTIVGIIMKRSIEMIAGILAILKAGGAYLPIDPQYPEDRITYMLKDSASEILVTTLDYSKRVKFDKEIIYISDAINRDPTPHHLSFHPSPPPSLSTSTCQVGPANLAYVIYTSGSTGKPKGVLVRHWSVVNILLALQREYPLGEKDTYLFKTSYLFDVSVTELFGWFLDSGRLAVLEKEAEKDPREILAAIEKFRVTHINFVPSMFKVFIEGLSADDIYKLSGLKYIFLAGEALPSLLVRKFRELGTNILLENIYGPTEGTIYSCNYSLSHWQGKGSIPIGKPMQNVMLYVLDKHNIIQPVGIAGELCIGGVGVARGYLNNPELTAQKFLCGSYSYYRSYVLYKTGDLTRWQADGNIEFLGRMDHQVKIRGFRIELGEIEKSIQDNDKIETAVVVTREKNDNKFLCAYYVSVDEMVKPEELKEYLARCLPYYMIPAYFMQLDRIPVTSNGKVDRRALPEPGFELSEDYIKPGTQIEKMIAEIWKQILGIDKIGVHTRFFDIGGNSVNILKVHSKLKETIKADFPLMVIFKYPTIYSLAGYLSSAGIGGDDIEATQTHQLDLEKTMMKQTLQKLGTGMGQLLQD